MKITAKFNSTCPKCSTYISAGEMVEWEKGQKARHVKCPTVKAAAPAPAPLLAAAKPAGANTNRKSGSCERCGTFLTAGKGLLYFCPEDSGCLKHHDHSGYHLHCQDKDACTKAREEVKAEQAKRAEVARKIQAEQKVKEALYTAWKTELTADLVQVEDALLPSDIEWLVRKFQNGYWTVSFGKCSIGYVETADGHDDFRTMGWTDRATAENIWDAWAEKVGMTPVKAQEWLLKYRGCCGTAAYEHIASKLAAA